ncbi:MAG: bifunctional 2-polyprenyl-6-hydroxyphenol methylase/3-demethylubiquinol 3-O-methyltransferase UbiG [Alphaproteobacteria bacterium]
MSPKAAQIPTGQNGTVDAASVGGFAALADEWWDPRGKFAPLHRINPARLGYVRAQAARHFRRDDQSATPLGNLSALDIGCGGGLVCEPLARLGATVTGIDAAEPGIDAARAHAAASGLSIDYRTATAEALADSGERFDLVLALEIVEHVADTGLFYDALARLVKPGGLLILSTLNRTAKSYALGIVAAEYLLRWVPRGTHRWSQFIRPSEMASSLLSRGFSIEDTAGIVFDPKRGTFGLDHKDLDVNYLLTASKKA